MQLVCMHVRRALLFRGVLQLAVCVKVINGSGSARQRVAYPDQKQTRNTADKVHRRALQHSICARAHLSGAPPHARNSPMGPGQGPGASAGARIARTHASTNPRPRHGRFAAVHIYAGLNAHAHVCTDGRIYFPSSQLAPCKRSHTHTELRLLISQNSRTGA